jgi:hypothetical protein
MVKLVWRVSAYQGKSEGRTTLDIQSLDSAGTCFPSLTEIRAMPSCGYYPPNLTCKEEEPVKNIIPMCVLRGYNNHFEDKEQDMKDEGTVYKAGKNQTLDAFNQG